MKTLLAPFERTRFELASEVLYARCQSPLDLRQPDSAQPECLLGTCGDCGVWYVIDLAASVMIALPVSEVLNDG